MLQFLYMVRQVAGRHIQWMVINICNKKLVYNLKNH